MEFVRYAARRLAALLVMCGAIILAYRVGITEISNREKITSRWYWLELIPVQAGIIAAGVMIVLLLAFGPPKWLTRLWKRSTN